ncbi:uncharacterized protein EI90DRAFT_3051018 [Cantharellus anzutake]|uniref:uncharacterized protein n=1 Tax=Cantharellus anzutake TaxID=1750568 RepID=UPI001907F509|nr:uncharacterized protein EI90DRAFT_3051018 [Cantharellus anzutake]KAF8334102.1 hypothetical protein EI90DRAFT_3051018 [Cantharellus anzutake]
MQVKPLKKRLSRLSQRHMPTGIHRSPLSYYRPTPISRFSNDMAAGRVRRLIPRRNHQIKTRKSAAQANAATLIPDPRNGSSE